MVTNPSFFAQNEFTNQNDRINEFCNGNISIPHQFRNRAKKNCKQIVKMNSHTLRVSYVTNMSSLIWDTKYAQNVEKLILFSKYHFCFIESLADCENSKTPLLILYNFLLMLFSVFVYAVLANFPTAKVFWNTTLKMIDPSLLHSFMSNWLFYLPLY